MIGVQGLGVHIVYKDRPSRHCHSVDAAGGDSGFRVVDGFRVAGLNVHTVSVLAKCRTVVAFRPLGSWSNSIFWGALKGWRGAPVSFS